MRYDPDNGETFEQEPVLSFFVMKAEVRIALLQIGAVGDQQLGVPVRIVSIQPTVADEVEGLDEKRERAR